MMRNLAETMQRSHRSPGHERILDALNRILGSADFIASDRNKRFLSYVVEETLAGRAERLKGYTVAVQVFGRDETFDAQADPLVRIEAGRLRQALERYYLKAGRGDPIRISIPKGGYVPVFEWIAPAVAAGSAVALPQPAPGKPSGDAARTRRMWAIGALLAAIIVAIVALGVTIDHMNGQTPQGQPLSVFGPSLLIQPFSSIGSEPAEQQLSAGLAEELATALARFKTIPIVAARGADGTAQAAGRAGQHYDYVLKGSVRRLEHAARIVVQLEDNANGALLWTRAFDWTDSRASAPDAQTEIAAQVATMLGDPYDVLFTSERRRIGTARSAAFEAYGCALGFYVYWEGQTAGQHKTLRACHEKIVSTQPLYADGWVNLAWLYLDEHRFGYNPAGAAPPALDRAAAAARQALALQPDNARAHLAMAVVQTFRGDLARFDQHADIALVLNSNDIVVAAELGLRFGLLGEWERALPLLERALSREPLRWQMYRVAYALHAIETGDYLAALDEVRGTRIANQTVIQALRTAVYGHLGRVGEARAEWQSVSEVIPGIVDAPRFWLASRNMSSRLICSILDGLDKAGVLHD